jgi:flagellar biosynthesis protein FlhB
LKRKQKKQRIFSKNKILFLFKDIGKFIIIFLIIFCGFMFGLNNLFWYYSESVRGKVQIISHNLSSDDPEVVPAEIYFGTYVLFL